VLPSPEVCATPKDDNCDGQINEGCPPSVEVNLAEMALDPIPVGIGGPFGLPKKAKVLTFECKLLPEVTAPEDLTLHFTLSPTPSAFSQFKDSILQLGGPGNQVKTTTYIIAATPEAENGTAGTLTVRLTRDTNPAAEFDEIAINLVVDK
jgi:hypothetical protein